MKKRESNVFYFFDIIALQNSIFQTPLAVNYERFGRFRAFRREENIFFWPNQSNLILRQKFDSSASPKNLTSEHRKFLVLLITS